MQGARQDATRINNPDMATINLKDIGPRDIKSMAI